MYTFQIESLQKLCQSSIIFVVKSHIALVTVYWWYTLLQYNVDKITSGYITYKDTWLHSYCDLQLQSYF